MNKIPDRLFCCICRQLVDKSTKSSSALTDEIYIRSECHGEVDMLVIDARDLYTSANPASLLVAFKLQAEEKHKQESLVGHPIW